MSTEIQGRIHSYYFWLDTHQRGTVMAIDTNDALAQVKKLYPHSTVKKYGHIPYPSNPYLIDSPSYIQVPTFCYTPEACLGKHSCPHGPACSE